MKLPFTPVQFFDVIRQYNLAVSPAQILILGLGFICVYLVHSNLRFRNEIIGTFLGLLWLWTGLVYHIFFFTTINKAAWLFGGLFILQGVLTLANALVNDRLVFESKNKTRFYTGFFFILYGLAAYPVISYLTEGSFGLAISPGLPCPSTILTFGWFLIANDKFPKYLLVIPALWAVVGVSAAINIGVYQDLMIIVSAIVTVILMLRHRAVTNIKRPVKAG